MAAQVYDEEPPEIEHRDPGREQTGRHPGHGQRGGEQAERVGVKTGRGGIGDHRLGRRFIHLEHQPERDRRDGHLGQAAGSRDGQLADRGPAQSRDDGAPATDAVCQATSDEA
jgi:hypothetical protein